MRMIMDEDYSPYAPLTASPVGMNFASGLAMSTFDAINCIASVRGAKYVFFISNTILISLPPAPP